MNTLILNELAPLSLTDKLNLLDWLFSDITDNNENIIDYIDENNIILSNELYNCFEGY